MNNYLTKSCFFISLIGVITIFNGCSEQAEKNTPTKKSAEVGMPQMPQTEVGTYTINQQEITLQQELPGRTVIALNSEIRPQIGGIIERQLFKEGSTVNKGDVLYKVVSSSYEAAYNEAKASYANVLANVKAAKLKDERYKDLLKIDGVSKQEYEDTNVAYLQALASVEEKKAAMQSAKINLEYTQITSPISGHIGISSVTEGALVTAQQETALATVRSLDPIYVDFTQSSVQMLNLKKLLKQENMKEASATVSLKLEDGSIYENKGEFKLQELAVDEATGSVTLRAQFPNPKNILLPGMYVNIIVNEAINTKAILVPQQGVTFDEKGNATAMIVNKNSEVEKLHIVIDRTINDYWLVKDGFNVGDHLIVEGLNKIRVGAKVKDSDITSNFKFDNPKIN
ncbi:RND family efflux system, membrane fusion protein [Arcobacter venerupis]|uniref:RND family efflux system, membrane fusion protein n=1 Tax=Arcobacter venerupis TaxID=1054033 RepID=A0AAE7BE22_9BACT|nr:efflux RND transporter periplasmic adaptor subunit [Arcobacter venerupis]QKF68570.1 RND family efflux system, membrane fusion protein [Arcobacter venerupis]RWS48733.1 efflux transporter periplasmic adaptor subunit [Arcobacter venerupis]